MSLWGQYLALFAYWKTIVNSHSQMDADWKAAHSFLGEDLGDENLREEKDKCDQMIEKPSTMPNDSLIVLNESLVALHEKIVQIGDSVEQIVESKNRAVDRLLSEDLDVQALQCLSKFKGSESLSTQGVSSAKTYLSKYKKAEAVLKKAKKEGLALCGKGASAERLWDHYKTLYKYIVVDRIDVNEAVTRVKPDIVKLLSDSKLIRLEELTHYKIEGFDACIEHDENE